MPLFIDEGRIVKGEDTYLPHSNQQLPFIRQKTRIGPHALRIPPAITAHMLRSSMNLLGPRPRATLRTPPHQLRTIITKQHTTALSISILPLSLIPKHVLKIQIRTTLHRRATRANAAPLRIPNQLTPLPITSLHSLRSSFPEPVVKDAQVDFMFSRVERPHTMARTLCDTYTLKRAPDTHDAPRMTTLRIPAFNLLKPTPIRIIEPLYFSRARRVRRSVEAEERVLAPGAGRGIQRVGDVVEGYGVAVGGCDEGVSYA